MKRTIEDIFEDVVAMLQDRSLNAVSEATGITYQTLMDIKARRRPNPTMKILSKLIQYFKIEV